MANDGSAFIAAIAARGFSLALLRSKMTRLGCFSRTVSTIRLAGALEVEIDAKMLGDLDLDRGTAGRQSRRQS